MGIRKVAVVVAAVALVASLTGCTSVARGIGKITSNKYANPRSGTIWTVPPPQLEPPAPEDKTVYISWRNISDSSLNMSQQLRDAASSQGWNVVSNPQEANYRLRASLRFFGEVDPESGGDRVARQMGWISGAAVGATSGALVANATDSWAAGVGVGAAAGGLAGVGISNASRPREWAMIIDFVLEEYIEGGVEFERFREDGTTGNTGAGTSNSRMTDTGGSRQSNTSNAQITQTSNYFPHGVRLSAWANQMNMQEEEALPLVEERVSKVVLQLLPQ